MSRKEDANKVPLGPPPIVLHHSSGLGSLLKPNYFGGGSGSTGSSGSHQHDDRLINDSYGYGGSNINMFNSAKMSTDYSRWGESSGVVAVMNQSAVKRENEDNRGVGNDSGTGERKRKRKSRWMGTENDKAIIPGMPTIISTKLTGQQTEQYIAQLQIEELSRKLRTGDLGINPNPEERSPSPEPIYGNDGKRLNTREYRTRKKFEEDRHALIQKLTTLNAEYKPPPDYRAPAIKIVDRVPIPQEENPDINFVGLLIGPRGNTLKGLEKDTGAKIIIRGKGSVKEGKVGGKAGMPMPGEDEPLHAYITSTNPESVKKACEKIKVIIKQGIDMPEHQNDLRNTQLRELALLNGTLREGDGPKCSNCGATSHRTWHCPDKPNVTNSVICTVCGSAGHIGKDCRMKRPGAGGPPQYNPYERAKIDQEYLSLMEELGQAAPAGNVLKGSSNGNGGGSMFKNTGPSKAIMAPAPGPGIQQGWSWGNSNQNPPPPPAPPGDSNSNLIARSRPSGWEQEQNWAQPQQLAWSAYQNALAPPPPPPPGSGPSMYSQFQPPPPPPPGR